MFNFKVFFSVFFAVIFLANCGGSSDDNFFYSSAKQVAPAITSTAAASSVAISTLDSTSMLGQILQVLQDYQNPRDEGVLDMHNIYKVLWEAGQQYTFAEGACSTITEAALTAPFDMGLNTTTYTCAGNDGTMTDTYAKGFAIKTVGDLKSGLMTFRWAPESTQASHGILQGDYNEATKDLNIRMVNTVEYTGGTGFVVRTHVSGNETTHAFNIAMVSTNLALTSYISVVGTGVSRGTGNYFLFKIRTNAVTDKYFCVAADATEAALETINTATPTGSDNVDVNCTIYQATVDAMTFLTTSDVPTGIASFTGSSILLTY